MYTVIYLYRVNIEKKQDFLDVTDKLKETFLDNGALEHEIYRADNLMGKDGCRGILDLVDVKQNEEVFLGQSVFRNQSHYEEVLDRVTENAESNQLMATLADTVDDSKTFTGSFSTPD